MASSNRGWNYGRFARKGMLTLSIGVCSMGLFGLTTTGCRISEDDVEGWARKASGPRKLVAVLQHDKYDLELRVDAGMTLVTMAPRGGRAVGLVGDDKFKGLLEGFVEMSAEERAPIINGMVPLLEEGILFVPKGDEADTSFAHKDAAFALLTHESQGLVTDPESKKRLKTALTAWCQENFETRLDDTTQLFGMEQVLRFVRAPGVRGLTPLIKSDFKKIRTLAKLIAEIGDDATKLDASKKLVSVAKHVDSDAWIKQKAPGVEAANKASGLTVKKKQFEKQLEAYQAEELLRMFGAMKSIGQKPIVDYLLGYAQDTKNPEDKRAAALAGLEGHLDRKNPAHAKAMLDFLSNDDTPDPIRDVAARRVGELSREQVAERLYGLFGNKRWQLRWTVASLLLKMSEAKDMDEFMGKLGKIKNMAISEPFSYGQLFNEVKDAKPKELAQKFSQKNYPAPVRLTALGYYYENGYKSDVPALEAFKSDRQRVPSCPKDALQCAWDCSVADKDPTKPGTLKAVKTVGDFVEYCLLPIVSEREPPKEKKATKAAPPTKAKK